MRLSFWDIPLEKRALAETKQALKGIGYYVYALSEVGADGNFEPFYIGYGKGARCLDHLDFEEQNNVEKSLKTEECLKKGTLVVEILRHDLASVNTARIVEATCIDILGVKRLTNLKRGFEKDAGRKTLSEIVAVSSQERVQVLPEHRGLAFLLDDLPKAGMTESYLYERTRGCWKNIPINKAPKYAYATHLGVVKQVYEIYSWVPAGTQEYFFFNTEEKMALTDRKEFVGRIAPKEISRRYVGNLIEKDRSYGDPFVLVGY